MDRKSRIVFFVLMWLLVAAIMIGSLIPPLMEIDESLSTSEVLLDDIQQQLDSIETQLAPPSNELDGTPEME